MTRTAHNKGKKSSLEVRIKQSKARGGRPFVSLRDGVVEQRFDLFSQAGQYYGVRWERVREVLRGGRKSTRGVVFQYINEEA